MEPVHFLGLQPTDDPLRWALPVRTELTARPGFLFGGVALGAAATVAELATGRTLVWATAQYLDHARPPQVVDLVATVPSAGRQTAQVRVVGAVDGAEIVTVTAAVGSRPVPISGTWAERPDVAPPADCPPREPLPGGDGTSLVERLELRMARRTGRHDGRTAVWARVPGLESGSVAALGVLGDMVPFGIREATGMTGTSNSLDNTLRVVRLVPTDWVLLDIRIAGVERGYGHGLVHLWAEDGTLLGTASQSAIVRPDRTLG